MNIIGRPTSDKLKSLQYSTMTLNQAYPVGGGAIGEEMPQIGEDPGGYPSQARILYWYHPDYIQNVDLVTDLDGEAYELFLYNPWGEELHHWSSNSSSWTSPYRFNAKEVDPETGLAYYGARYYQNKIGVWLSVDPLANISMQWSPYRFCFDNPLSNVDPSGLFEIDPEIQKVNPQFTAYLRGLKADFIKKPQSFKDAFYNASGLTEEQTLEMLTFGNGPKLIIKNLDVERSGSENAKEVNGRTFSLQNKTTREFTNENNGQGLIAIDDDIINYFERASTLGEKLTGELLLESTLYHEGTHFGNIKVNSSPHGLHVESGKIFEQDVYGQDVTRSNAASLMYESSRIDLPVKALKSVL